MSDREDAEVFATLLEKCHPIILQLNPGAAVTVIGQLQLALRHPSNRGFSAKATETLARSIQDSLASHHPEIGRLLERGWHPVFDVPADQELRCAGCGWSCTAPPGEDGRPVSAEMQRHIETCEKHPNWPLRQRIRQLERALRPFADMAAIIARVEAAEGVRNDDCRHFVLNQSMAAITVGDCRRARVVLTELIPQP